DIIFLLVILHRVGHVDDAPQSANAKGCVSRGKVGVGEGGRYWMELGVEHVHRAGVEIGGVEAVAARGRGGNRQARIDGATRRVIDGDLRLRGPGRRDAGVPASDHAGLAGKDEAGRATRRAARHDEAGTAVEDDAGGRAARDRYGQSELGPGVAVVERGATSAVVGHPPRRGGAGDEAPRVDEARIYEVGRHRTVG